MPEQQTCETQCEDVPCATGRRRRGKVIVALALAFPAVTSLAALAISLAHAQRSYSQLSAVVESAASASIDTLGTTRNENRARSAAQYVAACNNVQGKPLVLEDDDVEFGRYAYSGTSWEFTADNENPNAVRVVGRVVDDGRSGLARFVRILKTQELQIAHTTIATQLDRDIALLIDRSSAGAYSEDELLPLGLADLTRPLLAPLNWTWCLAAPLQSRFRNVMGVVDTLGMELAQTNATEYVALVSFADEARIESALALDFTRIVTELQRLASEYCGGASNKEEAIGEGIQALTDPATARPDAIKVMILISDSPHDEGDPVGAAETAHQQGIVVHTISYGPNVDQSMMRNIAAATGGEHWHAARRADISSALRQIAQSIPTVVVTD